MKKFLVLSLTLLTVFSLAISDVSAATNDFTADANITVSGVTFGDTTVDMLIMSGSTAESWSFSSGTFTVTNPGTIFKIGSSSSAVKILTSTQGGNTVSCAVNSTPGTSYGELPTAAGTYTIVPSTTSSCGGGGGAPAGGSSSAGPATYQSYDPATGKTSTEQKTTTPAAKAGTPAAGTATGPATDINLVNVLAEASSIAKGVKEQILAQVGKVVDAAKEATLDKSVVSKVVANIKTVTTEAREKILTFVTYGTGTTDYLGAGERGGVVNSFKEAFGRLPANDKDWEDVVKIANGRWPSQIDASREKKAETAFRTIYKRAPGRSNAKDDAAVVVMAYGLRPRDRNLNSEKAAITSFKGIFKKSPQTATDWDTVRAIAYSGATR